MQGEWVNKIFCILLVNFTIFYSEIVAGTDIRADGVVYFYNFFNSPNAARVVLAVVVQHPPDVLRARQAALFIRSARRDGLSSSLGVTEARSFSEKSNRIDS